MTKEALKLARQLLWRYRHETPIGHQPYMICHEADEAFERIDKALAQPAQGPVAKYSDIFSGGGLDPRNQFDVPKREWVGLTDKETSGFTQHEMTVAKYVSKVLQEKNT